MSVCVLCGKYNNLYNLTSREIDILKELSQGKTNKEIGIELKISEKTVKNHLSSIYPKLGVFDRTQAVVFIYKNNLFEH